MGRRGPRPTPTAILALQGSRKAGRNKYEPQPTPGRPECPDWLDERGRECWESVVPELEVMGVLTLIDANALARYCDAHSRYLEAIEWLRENGTYYELKDEKGNMRCIQQYPYVAIANNLAGQLMKLEQEFGMTPSARTRIQVQPMNETAAVKSRKRA